MPTTQPLTRKALMRQIRAAQLTVARTALANPFMYHEAGELVDARRLLKEAQERLTRAEKAWAALIAPAAGWAPDPLKE